MGSEGAMGEEGRRSTFCCVITYGSCADAENHRAPRGDEARGRSSGHQARYCSGAPANHGPFPRKPEVEEDPGCGGEHSRQVGVPAGHDSTQICAEAGTAVEAEPAEP